MNNITFKTITDLATAEEIWRELSPSARLTDDWAYRYTYYKFFNYPLFFFTAFEDEKAVGVLPLQWNSDSNVLQFFGGSHMEDNQMYVKPGYESLKAALIKQIDRPALLEWMTDDIPGIPNVQIQEYKYEFPLSKITSIDDYLERYWNAKPRQNLRAQLRKLHEQNIKVEYNVFSDFDLMVELNKMRFGEESGFLRPHRLEFFKEIMTLFPMQIISISLNGKKVSIGMSIFYKGTYVGLNSGTDSSINGLGKFLILQKMTQALSLGATLYDARSENLGWKEAFHFDKRPLYSLEIK
ncbi:MAG: GNAT family N-acetyltransferase [Patescibacteria group bacterium]